MLRLFGGSKPDHPMGDPKELRRILDEFPSQDAAKAVEDLIHWHESVADAEGFKLEQRLAIHLQLDHAAQAKLRKLSREYFGASRPSRFQENRLWGLLHGYWQQAGVAYARLIDAVIQPGRSGDSVKAQWALLFSRALYGVGQRIKWLHLRYGPIEPAVWGLLNNVYGVVEARGVADATTTVYPGGPESTPRVEYLKALLFSAGSPDSLLPSEIEIAERLVAEVARGGGLNTDSSGAAYWIDISRPMAPSRLLREPAAAPGIRYLNTAGALQRLAALPRAAEGEDEELRAGVLEHLKLYWSRELPERKSARHAVKSRLTVLAGPEAVFRALDTSGGSLDFDATDGESWIVENVSAGGFGAVVPQLKGDWLKVGALLALQPEGGANWIVGIVRRVNRTSAQQARVGIQTLSRSPRGVALALSSGDAHERGLLLPSGDAASAETLIVLKPGAFDARQNLESAYDGRHHVFLPVAVSERGDGYEIGRYREMIREE